MTDKRIASIAALIAAIGILLFGVAKLICSLHGSNVAIPRSWSYSYVSGGPMPSPMRYSHPYTNLLLAGSYTNKLSPKDIAALVSSLKKMETHFIANSNNFAGAVASAFTTNAQLRALGIEPDAVSNAIIRGLSGPEMQKHLRSSVDHIYLKELLENAIISQPSKLTKVQTKIIQ